MERTEILALSLEMRGITKLRSLLEEEMAVMFSDTTRQYLVINVREESANMACKGPDSKCFQLCGWVSSWSYSSAIVV